jgi:diaminopimelate epimerase
MSKFDFTKMHGAGNDFIMIDDMEARFDESPALISALCESHRGIGADGLILLRSAGDGADFAMRYFNCDGSEAEMCGNGARCAAKFALERGVAGKIMTFLTGAGPVSAEVDGSLVRIGLEPVHGLRLEMELSGGIKAGFVVSGVPHAAVFVDDARSWDAESLLKTARAVRYDKSFEPAGTNVNIVTVESRDRLVYRTYERGVEAETLACGTGAIGVSVIAAHMGLVASPVRCETSGGDELETSFELTEDGARGCALAGPAVTSFTGNVDIADYVYNP